jgi:NitT/TauT family transport system substrate-binding protein
LKQFKLVALLVPLLAMIGVDASRAQSPVPLPTIRVASSPNENAVPVLYAIREGLFRKAGIDVTLDHASSGAAIASGVAGGAIDVGVANVFSLVLAHVHGVGFVLIAPGAIHLPNSANSGIIVGATSPIRSARDLNGKTISVPALNDIGRVGIAAWADANGGDSSTLRFIEMPVSSVLSALEQGRIDAGSAFEPQLSEAVAAGKVRFVGDYIGSLGGTILESAFFTSKEFMKNNRTVIERFSMVMKQATEYTNSHHAQTAELLSTFTGLDLDSIVRSKRPVIGTLLDPRYIQPTIDAAAKYKVIPQVFDARELLSDGRAN